MTTADTDWQAPPRLRPHRCPDPRLSTRLCMTNCVCAIVYMFMCTYICVYTTTHTHLCMLNKYYVNLIVYLILCILNCVYVFVYDELCSSAVEHPAAGYRHRRHGAALVPGHIDAAERPPRCAQRRFSATVGSV